MPSVPRNVVHAANQALRTLAAGPENDIPRRILKRIKMDGYGCTAVVPDPPAQPRGWTYTAGLCLYRMPELVIAHMPSQEAIVYLDHAAGVQRGGLTLAQAGTLVMADGSEWAVAPCDPRATWYGLRQTMRLFGGTHQVRALRLLPPPELRWEPGSSWAGYRCRCGCGKPATPGRQEGTVSVAH